MGREEAPRLLRRKNTCILWIAPAQPRLPALIAPPPEPRQSGHQPVMDKNCFGHWALEFIWDLGFVIWDLWSHALYGSGYAGLG